MCSSGWGCSEAAWASCACKAARSAKAWPFHEITELASMSMRTICGGLGGGVVLATGMSRLTACNCAGMVMISMINSTSITSISGVVLMSIISSSSSGGLKLGGWWLRKPVLGFMSVPRVGDEADFGDARALHGVHHLPDGGKVALRVAANVYFRLGLQHRKLF